MSALCVCNLSSHVLRVSTLQGTFRKWVFPCSVKLGLVEMKIKKNHRPTKVWFQPEGTVGSCRIFWAPPRQGASKRKQWAISQVAWPAQQRGQDLCCMSCLVVWWFVVNLVILQSKYLNTCYVIFVSVFCSFYAVWAIQVFWKRRKLRVLLEVNTFFLKWCSTKAKIFHVSCNYS